MEKENARDFARLESVGTVCPFNEELRDRLSATPMFADLSWPELKAISAYMRAYRVSPGAEIFSEGDAGDYFGLVLDGRIEVFKQDQNENRQLVGSIAAGKTFGEMALLDGERRSASCVAPVETTLVVLNRGNFDKLLHETPALGVKLLHKLARVLSQRLRVASGQLVDFIGH